jgi:hypothetical protein
MSLKERVDIKIKRYYQITGSRPNYINPEIFHNYLLYLSKHAVIPLVAEYNTRMPFYDSD